MRRPRFGSGMGLFPIYVGPQLEVDRDVNDDTIQQMPGDSSDLVLMPGGTQTVRVNPVLQGEDDSDDIVVTPDAVESAQGIILGPSNTGPRRGSSIVSRRVYNDEGDTGLTPSMIAAADGGENDVVLSGMCGFGLGATAAQIAAARARVAAAKAAAAQRTAAATAAKKAKADALAAAKAALIQQQTQELLSLAQVSGFPADQIPMLLQGLGYAATRAKLVAYAKRQSVAALAADAAAQKSALATQKVASAAAAKQAVLDQQTQSLMMLAATSGFPADQIPELIQGLGLTGATNRLKTLAKIKATADTNLYRQSLQQMQATGAIPAAAANAIDPTTGQPYGYGAVSAQPYSVAPSYPDVSAQPVYPSAMYASGGGASPDAYPDSAMASAQPQNAPYNEDPDVVPLNDVDNAVMVDADTPTQVPYGNAGAENFDVDVAPSLPGGESAVPRRVYPSMGMRTRQLQSEAETDSMGFDDVNPAGIGGFIGDSMPDGFMSAPKMSARPWDTIGGAGYPKGVTHESEDVFEQESSEQIDAMSRPGQLAQGNFAGAPYKLGESMIPFGRSFKGDRMDILDTSVVGLDPSRVAGRLTLSPVGYDENLLVDGEPVMFEGGGGTGEEFVSLGAPSAGASGAGAALTAAAQRAMAPEPSFLQKYKTPLIVGGAVVGAGLLWYFFLRKKN